MNIPDSWPERIEAYKKELLRPPEKTEPSETTDQHQPRLPEPSQSRAAVQARKLLAELRVPEELEGLRSFWISKATSDAIINPVEYYEIPWQASRKLRTGHVLYSTYPEIGYRIFFTRQRTGLWFQEREETAWEPEWTMDTGDWPYIASSLYGKHKTTIREYQQERKILHYVSTLSVGVVLADEDALNEWKAWGLGERPSQKIRVYDNAIDPTKSVI